MVKDDAAEQDLHFMTEGEVGVSIEVMTATAVAGGGVANTTGYDLMEEEHQLDKDMWLDRDQESLLDVNEASIFYDDFPSLPDFPCMSSSSSSSSTQPPSKPIAGTSCSSSATSSSPAASWATLMRSDAEEDTTRVSFQQLQDEAKMEVATAALSSTASMEIQPPPEHDGGLGDVDCIDVMENFGYMDLIDCNELWDPSSVFQSENPQDFADDQQAAAQAVALPMEGTQQGNVINCDDDNDGLSFLQGNSELAMIFFEWLKQNKDYISAEDMRSIKLKRSTIESASKRLGSSKEGKKQLLKLILEWVEQYQLQKKARLPEGGAAAQSPYSFDETVQIQDPNQNPNFIYNPDPNTTFPPTQWMQPVPPPHVSEVGPMVAPPAAAFAPTMHGYSADPYSNSMPMNHGSVVNGIPYQHSAEYPVMEHAPSWAMSPYAMPPSQFSPYPDNGGGIVNRQQSMYGNPYQMYDPNGERIMRLGSSATKEARKKRMARQRRLYSHHHRHCSNSNQHQTQLNDPHLVADGVDDGDQGTSPGDWMYWSPNGGASSPTATNVPPADAVQPNSGDRATMQPQNSQRQASTDRRQQQQGWKTEKNLKFLLQKVLKQSDVGNLGRIVLPKKEAESHLPELETRDGISIAMEDIGTSRVWNMRYRFWPNNKSRMYLLENTGDFVRVNGLQEGDFIVIYSDAKCGKYMIRGVKVRQPGGKLEGKKPVRRNIRNLSSLAGNSSSLTPIRQAVR